MNIGVPEIFKSKKFQVLIGSIITVLSQDTVPGVEMTEKTVMAIVALAIAWMFAQGAADHVK